MKKFTAILCCLALVCLLSITAFAASGNVTLSASSSQLKPGDTFTVTATLNRTDKIKLCTVALEFDEKVLQLTGGECKASGTMLGQVLANQKAGTFLYMNKKDCSGTVFTFDFRVLDKAPVGKVQIGAIAAIGVDSGEEIPVTGCEVTVACDHVPGPAATAEKPQTCTLCGAELAPAKGTTSQEPVQETTATEETTGTTGATVATEPQETTETTAPSTQELLPGKGPQMGEVVIQKVDPPKNENGLSVGWVIAIFAVVGTATGVGIYLWRKHNKK